MPQVQAGICARTFDSVQGSCDCPSALGAGPEKGEKRDGLFQGAISASPLHACPAGVHSLHQD